MSASNPVALAPYPFRHRLAVTGLALAWILAGLFLVLGLRAENPPPSMTGGTATQSAVAQ